MDAPENSAVSTNPLVNDNRIRGSLGRVINDVLIALTLGHLLTGQPWRGLLALLIIRSLSLLWLKHYQLSAAPSIVIAAVLLSVQHQDLAALASVALLSGLMLALLQCLGLSTLLHVVSGSVIRGATMGAALSLLILQSQVIATSVTWSWVSTLILFGAVVLLVIRSVRQAFAFQGALLGLMAVVLVAFWLPTPSVPPLAAPILIGGETWRFTTEKLSALLPVAVLHCALLYHLSQRVVLEHERVINEMHWARPMAAITAVVGLASGLPATLDRRPLESTKLQLLGLAVVLLLLGLCVFWMSWFTPLVAALLTLGWVFGALKDAPRILEFWSFNRDDALTVLVVAGLSPLVGLPLAISVGFLLSVGFFVTRTGRPEVLELGRVPGTQQFRTVRRMGARVETTAGLSIMRVGESWLFVNARWVEKALLEALAQSPPLRHLLIVCGPIGQIDLSGIAAFERVLAGAQSLGVTVHLSEVRAPLRRQLDGCGISTKLSGEIFVSTAQAVDRLSLPDVM